MDEAGTLVGLIGGVIGFVVFLAAAITYLRGSWDKGTITSLKESNSALTDRVQILEKENTLNKTEIEKLVIANKVLRDVVTQSAEIQHLQITLEGHDKIVRAALERVIDNDDLVVTILNEIKSEIIS